MPPFTAANQAARQEVPLEPVDGGTATEIAMNSGQCLLFNGLTSFPQRRPAVPIMSARNMLNNARDSRKLDRVQQRRTR